MTDCNSNDVKKVASLDPREAIEIVGGTNINVVEEILPDKTRYTINYQEYAAPSITVAYSGGPKQVGTKVASATFSGAIIQGSENIVERTMTPSKGLNLELPISYTETDVLGATTGLYPRFSGNPTVITAKDSTGNTVIKQVGVEFRHLFYVGFSTKDTLTESEIRGIVKADHGVDLLTSIFSKYSSYKY